MIQTLEVLYFWGLPKTGAIAQLVERLNGIQEVRSSTLLSSTLQNPSKKPENGDFRGVFLFDPSGRLFEIMQDIASFCNDLSPMCPPGGTQFSETALFLKRIPFSYALILALQTRPYIETNQET